MKKRVIAGIAISLSLLAGTAYAASNGTFNGNEIIKLKVNGKYVNGDVPAINYEGRTMVPVRFVSDELGAGLYFDTDTNTVEITPKTQEVQKSTSSTLDTVKQLAKEAAKYNGKEFFIAYTSDGAAIYVRYDENGTTDDENIYNLLKLMLSSEATSIHISVYKNNSAQATFSVKQDDLEQYQNNKLSSEEFVKRWIITNEQKNNFSTSSLPSTTQQTQITPQTQTTQPTPSPANYYRITKYEITKKYETLKKNMKNDQIRRGVYGQAYAEAALADLDKQMQEELSVYGY